MFKMKTSNSKSCIAICTLWTPVETVTRYLNPESYFLAANLYTSQGINNVIRTVFQNPQIRYIVLCGEDKTQTGKILLDFIEGKKDKRLKIEQEIPPKDVNLFKKSIKIIDLRNLKNYQKLAKKIVLLKPLSPFSKPKTFPQSQLHLETYPSEKTGFVVRGKTVVETWLGVLKLVCNFGIVKPSEYNIPQKELLNITAVITNENPSKPILPSWLPFTKKDLEDYYPRVLTAKDVAGLAYTYGGRLRNYRGIAHDQICQMINKLRKSDFSRRAIGITWDPLVDSQTEHPPCLIQLLAHIQEKNFYLTATFRSHDIFGAWPENAFALRKLQFEMVGKLKCRVGSLTIISHSAHIYQDKWKEASDLLEKHYVKTQDFISDPRGYFLISVTDPSTSLGPSKILVEHVDETGQKTGLSFEGKSAEEISLDLLYHNLVSDPRHWLYLGRELQKAEMALKQKLVYKQDASL